MASPVIEMGRFLTSDVQEFSARQRLGATAVDASRTFVERIYPIRTTSNRKSTITYTRSRPAARAPAADAAALGERQMRGAARRSCCTTAW